MTTTMTAATTAATMKILTSTPTKPATPSPSCVFDEVMTEAVALGLAFDLWREMCSCAGWGETIGLGRFQDASMYWFAVQLSTSARSHFLHESSRTDSGRNGNEGGANTKARSSHATRVRLEMSGNQPR